MRALPALHEPAGMIHEEREQTKKMQSRGPRTYPSTSNSLRLPPISASEAFDSSCSSLPKDPTAGTRPTRPLSYGMLRRQEALGFSASEALCVQVQCVLARSGAELQPLVQNEEGHCKCREPSDAVASSPQALCM